MGKRRTRRSIFPRKKRLVFTRSHPIKRKMVVRQRKVKAFFHRHSPKIFISKGVKRVVGRIYTVSDKVKDNAVTLDNPFSAQFYQSRCCIQ